MPERLAEVRQHRCRGGLQGSPIEAIRVWLDPNRQYIHWTNRQTAHRAPSLSNLPPSISVAPSRAALRAPPELWTGAVGLGRPGSYAAPAVGALLAPAQPGRLALRGSCDSCTHPPA